MIELLANPKGIHLTQSRMQQLIWMLLLQVRTQRFFLTLRVSLVPLLQVFNKHGFKEQKETYVLQTNDRIRLRPDRVVVKFRPQQEQQQQQGSQQGAAKAEPKQEVKSELRIKVGNGMMLKINFSLAFISITYL